MAGRGRRALARQGSAAAGWQHQGGSSRWKARAASSVSFLSGWQHSDSCEAGGESERAAAARARARTNGTRPAAAAAGFQGSREAQAGAHPPGGTGA